MAFEPLRPQFPTTQWSDFEIVKAGGSAGAAAMERLCKIYWFPLYAYVRRQNYTHEAAEDLTQDFFTFALSKDFFLEIQPTGGRFRSFLLTSFQNFIRDRNRHARRQIRCPPGGWEPWDEADLEERYQNSIGSGESPEQEFTRQWALTVLDRAFREIEADYTSRNKAALVKRLIPFLWDDPEATSHADTAQFFGMTESAIKTEVYRLKSFT
jgi:DNA-directed RNA polymerase specialized sigma24 family protein